MTELVKINLSNYSCMEVETMLERLKDTGLDAELEVSINVSRPDSMTDADFAALLYVLTALLLGL